jgi:predicted regulator of Ras-like GTPase activity (Roadblock/LC7/MglB family)
LKVAKEIDRFQGAVEYLTEYPGVRKALIGDHEGLVIAESGSKTFDCEAYLAHAVALIDIMEKKLDRLAEPKIEHLSLRTANDWLTIAKTANLFLVVVADTRTNDLLNVRISRSLEMISSHFKSRYTALLARQLSKNMEAVNV